MEKQLRVILNCLAPFLEVDGDYLVSVVCRDEGDRALLDYLRSKGGVGITPTEACGAEELERFRLKPFHITRRIQRMNKRLKKELDQFVAEKRGWRWALTKTVYDIWGATKKEIKDT